MAEKGRVSMIYEWGLGFRIEETTIRVAKLEGGEARNRLKAIGILQK